MNKKKSYGLISLLLAVFLAIGSVVYIIWRGVRNRSDWTEYENTGIDTGLC